MVELISNDDARAKEFLSCLGNGNGRVTEEDENPIGAESIISNKCSRCSNDKKLYAKGLCKSCYNYLRLNKDKHYATCKKWREAHPTYFKEYYSKWKTTTSNLNSMPV